MNTNTKKPPQRAQTDETFECLRCWQIEMIKRGESVTEVVEKHFRTCSLRGKESDAEFDVA